MWEQMGTIDAAAIGRKTVRLGAAGHGGRMKLVVNVYPSFLVGGVARRSSWAAIGHRPR